MKTQNLQTTLIPLAIVLFTTLALSGFLPLLVGKHLSGVLLVLHVTAAPVFALLLAAWAVLQAHRHRFVAGDAAILRSLVQARNFRAFFGSQTAAKLFFWLALVMALPLIFSILLRMLPLFGTAGQEALLQWHRFSAFFFALGVLGWLVSQSKHFKSE